MNIPEPRIPRDIPDDRFPDLLRNWFLGSRSRAYIARRRFRAVTALLDAAPRGRALDAGCGWGYNLFLLANEGFAPVGIDIVQSDFLAARKIAEANGFNAMLAGADLASLPFAADSFAAVTAVETFEHVYESDRAAALSEAWRVLVPGGALAFSTPNYSSIVETGKRAIVKMPVLKRFFPGMCYPASDVKREDYHPYRYHKPAPRAEIVRLLENAGFRVASMRTIIFIWKNVPDALFPLVRFSESILERIPLVRALASTLVVLARKPA
ncbi:MAG: class I SAM-dependent methyltransferase [Candidatus Krumholzibacteria bacterium]|nr:class I SAM-dependent methyltransferase [Candidatus Krumholzibacteria bacterium]